MLHYEELHQQQLDEYVESNENKQIDCFFFSRRE